MRKLLNAHSSYPIMRAISALNLEDKMVDNWLSLIEKRPILVRLSRYRILFFGGILFINLEKPLFEEQAIQIIRFFMIKDCEMVSPHKRLQKSLTVKLGKEELVLGILTVKRQL